MKSLFNDITSSVVYPRLLLQLNDVIMDMARTGFCLDTATLAQKAELCRADVARCRAQLEEQRELAGAGPINWNSTVQLNAFLHGTLGLPPAQFCAKGRVRRGKVALDSTALEWLESHYPHPALEALRNYRRLTKLLTYLDGLPAYVAPEDGRIHTTIGCSDEDGKVLGTRTGRWNSRNPNLQNIPARKDKDTYRLREAFVAPPGRRLVVADWSALEMVILGHCISYLFGDDSLLARTAPGAPDIHSETARYVYGQFLGDKAIAEATNDEIKKKYKVKRDAIKIVRYKFNYCGSVKSFGETITNDEGEPIGEKLAQRLADGLLAFDPGIKRYQDFVWEQVAREQYITSLYGRWTRYPDATPEKKYALARAWRQACNYPMQAGGQEIAAAAMLTLAGRNKKSPGLESVDPTARLVLAVHDELIVECSEERVAEVSALVEHAMTTNWLPFRGILQAEAHSGQTWEEAKGT